jgi:hypothetical protein
VSIEPGPALAARAEGPGATLTAPAVADHHALLQRDVAAGNRPARRRRGPLTIEAARAEAEDALHRDALLDLFFDFSRQFFDYAVLFLVQADIAEGRDAFGNGASRDRVLGIGVPLDLPSLLASAREKRAVIVATVPSDGLDAVLLADLQRPRESEIAVVPLLVRARAVALLVGDCGEAGIDRDSVRQVVAFGGVVGKAFERIIVRRKLDGFIAGSRSGTMSQVADPAAVPSKSVPPPSIAAPLTARSVTPPRDVPPPGRTTSPSMPGAAAPSITPPLATTLTAAPAAGRRPSSAPPPPANIATMRPISGPPIPREEPESPPSVEAAGTGPASLASAPGAGIGRSDAPELESSTADVEEDATVLFDTFAREIVAREVEGAIAAPSSAVAVPAHRPPAAQSGAENGLPLVIVDVAAELGPLVDRLVAGEEDEAAEIELLRQGERAMPALMARFPGPLVFERARIATMANPPRASECGVVLRLVARERKVALPFVVERLTDPDSERRGWATHLIAELPYVEALPAVLERLHDDDAATRVSAGCGIAAIARSHPGRVTQTLRDRADDADPRQRASAMQAASAVRDSALVPLLLRGLGDGTEPVVAAARAALVVVTRQDFGPDARPWMKWWDQNSGRHRLEWLIDALTHDVSEVRRAAGDELRLLSRQYFGFSSDLPLRDRERAQQRYRDWWITEGRANQRRL